MASKINISIKTCAGCLHEITGRQYMICSLCNKTYDLLCANVPEKRYFNTMTLEHKQKWKCQNCICKQPKMNNINTPIKPLTQDDVANITQRKHLKSPVPIETYDRSESSVEEHYLDDRSILGDTINSTTTRTSPPETSITIVQISELLDIKLETYEKKIITQISSEIRNLIKEEIEKSILNLKTEMISHIDTIATEQINLKIKIDCLEEKVLFMETQRNQLENKIQDLQKDVCDMKRLPPTSVDNGRKFVLYGLDEYKWEHDDELYDRILNILYDIMNINLEGYIEDIHRLGKKGYRRPIVVELTNRRITKNILQNYRAFTGTGMAVTEYLDGELMEKRKELGKILQEARRQGKHAVFARNKLIINGKEYIPNKKEELDMNVNTTHNRINILTKQTHPQQQQLQTTKDTTPNTSSPENLQINNNSFRNNNSLRNKNSFRNKF